jgi:L-asparaginase
MPAAATGWAFGKGFSLKEVIPMVPDPSSGRKPRVVVVATGGTIATLPDPQTGALVPARTGKELIAAVPETQAWATLEVIQFGNVNSPNITPADWARLAELIDGILATPYVVGLVITHGTSTLEETAYFLDLTLKSEKPVVMTGSMRSAKDRGFDGPGNIIDAVRVAVTPEAAGSGVLNGSIHAAREGAKTHKSQVQTFQSGAWGCLGFVDPDRVVFGRRPLRRQTLPLPERLPRVDLISLYTGADGSYVVHALDEGAEGIVVAGFGLGQMNEPMAEGIGYALQKGIPVVVSSRVPEGRIVPTYGGPGGAVTLRDMGCVFSDDLSPWKARILLMLALPLTRDPKRLQAYFDR